MVPDCISKYLWYTLMALLASAMLQYKQNNYKDFGNVSFLEQK